jgi:hypothetical protein
VLVLSITADVIAHGAGRSSAIDDGAALPVDVGVHTVLEKQLP